MARLEDGSLGLGFFGGLLLSKAVGFCGRGGWVRGCVGLKDVNGAATEDDIHTRAMPAVFIICVHVF